jgi:hypothetical protein
VLPRIYSPEVPKDDCNNQAVETAAPFTKPVYAGDNQGLQLLLRLVVPGRHSHRAGNLEKAIPRERGRQTAVELILGLRLLLAEAHIPALLRGSLIELDQSLQDYRAGQLSEQALVDQLAGLLSPYEVYREGLAQIEG